MHRELFFPTPVYIANINDQNLNQQLERDIIAWSNRDKGLSRTNVKGWHSTTNMNELPEYKKLVDILYEAQRVIYEQENFPETSMSKPRVKPVETPSRLWREAHFEPIAGRLIMFPSWLTHAVDPNESNEIRISVSFNFMQKCLIT